MRNLFIILICTLLSACSIIIVNNDERNNTNSSPTPTVYREKEPCKISKMEFGDTPKIPLERIISTAKDYKEKSTILVDYITDLRLYIANLKKEVRENDDRNIEKCSR